tara:strand:+ start:181 stop:561 length:381 start_codon:yes stop_codon:yes gene_type:complete
MLLQIDAYNKDNLPMHEIANRMGISRSHFQAFKAGRKGMTLHNLEKLADVLKCKPSQLLPQDWQTLSASDSDTIITLCECVISYANKFNITDANQQSKVIAALLFDFQTNPTEDDLRTYFKLVSFS